jgi:hypothetical protein
MFTNIIEIFKNSDIHTIHNNIKLIKKNIKELNKESIIELNNEINIITNTFFDNKKIVSSLKSLSILCNKKIINTKTNFVKKINSFFDGIDSSTHLKRIHFYLEKITKYIETNCEKEREREKEKDIDKYEDIIQKMENIIYTKIFTKKSDKIINTIYILKLINKYKKRIQIPKNDLENILYTIDNNIYDYIYFLYNNHTLITSKEDALSFISNIGYIKKNFPEIDQLNLKRGFIQGLEKDNKDYLLKYQPNKSFMELVINSSVKLYDNKYFLTPSLFFINNDNSYFYIIEKYNTDLYKYFHLLGDSKIITLNTILSILFFVLNGIILLHKKNIIHSDLKLENIVLNIDEKKDIKELKIIDFDVALFDSIPKSLENISELYDKRLHNKKIRGTRIYMLKDESMSFKNDIYSLGVIGIILLYKNIKSIISNKKKILKEDMNIDDSKKNKNLFMKYTNLIKKLNILREKIEDDKVKIKILDVIHSFLKKNNNIDERISQFFDKNDYKFSVLKEFIVCCLQNTYDSNQLLEKYKDHLFSEIIIY